MKRPAQIIAAAEAFDKRDSVDYIELSVKDGRSPGGNMSNYTASQIARMIRANVAAANYGRITWDQFRVVNAATWELATRGEPCVIGSACSRRMASVHRELAKAEAA